MSNPIPPNGDMQTSELWGFSGFSGVPKGWGVSGFSGVQGSSGYSGYSGVSGVSGSGYYREKEPYVLKECIKEVLLEQEKKSHVEVGGA